MGLKEILIGEEIVMNLFFKKKENDEFTLNEIAKWLDNTLTQNIPENVVAFCFNLYDDGNSYWSMELVGTSRFDTDDADWACDEITNFGTREKRFTWRKVDEWNVILKEVVSFLTEYLKSGKYARILKSRSGVGVGFVDGKVTVIYSE